MSYKFKLKIKMLLYHLLGILTLLVILGLGWLNNKFIETLIIVICFYIYRPLFEKQYHCKSLIHCSLVSVVVFGIISNVTIKINVSLFGSIMTTLVVTGLSYIIRDYLDIKVLAKMYHEKLKSLNSKALENLTEDELIAIMPKIKYDVIHIVYNYLHRPNYQRSVDYAYKNNISEATLFRYVKLVKENYERLT